MAKFSKQTLTSYTIVFPAREHLERLARIKSRDEPNAGNPPSDVPQLIKKLLLSQLSMLAPVGAEVTLEYESTRQIHAICRQCKARRIYRSDAIHQITRQEDMASAGWRPLHDPLRIEVPMNPSDRPWCMLISPSRSQ